jgi:hypothetical protein
MNLALDEGNTGKQKSAAIFGVSEDNEKGYSRKVGLSFFTSSFDLDRSERMRIDSIGNVGIGTKTPTVKLDIQGAHTNTKARLYSTGDGKGKDASLDMWASEPKMSYGGSGIGNNINGSPHFGRRNNSVGQSYIRFYEGNIYLHGNDGDARDSYRMTILNNGKVGIGTKTPTEKL